ncbi:DNA methyltransferase, partial [Lactobacillus salivarius]|nr:DNA methyltransferase [Ligilactobacillus salivarius]
VTPDNLKGLTIESFLEDDQVYLTPNMTYYPRVIKKPKGYVVNGSIAILIPKEKIKVSEKQRKFLCSSDFEKFYAIARNYGTRSLNIDKNSVFFFGLYK